LDPSDTISDTFCHFTASRVISRCFACGVLLQTTSESLVNSRNMYLSPTHFRLRKIVFRYL